MRKWIRNRRKWALRYALIQREAEERAFEDAVWWLLRAQTALNVAQAQLHEHIELLRGIVDSAGEGILVVDQHAQTVLLNINPKERIGQAMAIYGMGIMDAPIIGPTLGGWLTDTFSWRYAFYINIPVGILAFFMIARFVHDPPYIKNAKVGAFDNIGFGLLIVWTGCLQVVLDKGQEDDWFGALWVRWAVAALAIGFIGWIWRSWTNPRAASNAPCAIPR